MPSERRQLVVVTDTDQNCCWWRTPRLSEAMKGARSRFPGMPTRPGAPFTWSGLKASRNTDQATMREEAEDSQCSPGWNILRSHTCQNLRISSRLP